MSSESKRYSVEISDPELMGALEAADNRSEMIRDAVRELINGDAPNEMGGLEETHKVAYEWLKGRGKVSLGEAESSIAVQTQLNKDLVRISALEPLEKMGLVKVMPSMTTVQVKAIPPVECFGCGADVPPDKLGDHRRAEHREVSADE